MFSTLKTEVETENAKGSRLVGMQIEKRSAFLDESKFLCCLNFSSLVLQKNHVKNKIKTYSYLNCSVKYHLCPGCFLPLWMKVLGEVCDWEVEKAFLSLDVSNLWLVGTTDVLKPHKAETLQKGHTGWVRLIHMKRSDLQTETDRNTRKGGSKISWRSLNIFKPS